MEWYRYVQGQAGSEKSMQVQSIIDEWKLNSVKSSSYMTIMSKEIEETWQQRAECIKDCNTGTLLIKGLI